LVSVYDLLADLGSGMLSSLVCGAVFSRTYYFVATPVEINLI